PFQSYFSGNTLQICPAGALTSAAYRFRSRPFDLVSVPSIAEHDACGSAIRVDYRRGLVMRRLAGDDPEVNEEWITDKDRYAFAYGRGPDRLTRPLVRHTDADGDTVMRPASWPEAIDVAVRGLQAALRPPATAAGDEAADAIAAASPGSRVGVLTGGRLTQEDAYGYAKFARAVLGTNNIDFRSRPNSREEAEFLAHAVAGTGRGVTYADLEQARRVLLVAFEPEEEAGAIFLRLRKAVRKKGLRVATVAPYLSNGNHKLDATLVATAPGAEARVLADLPVDLVPDADTIILVGERAALASGTLSAVLDLAEHTGARLAWVPRRAGDRGAIEAGCLPDLLPGGRPVGDPAARVDVAATWGSASLPTEAGRDIDEMLFGAGDAELGGLIVAGVDPGDLLDPTAALEGLEKVGFVVSIETRASAVTERADVVLPVSLIEERPGTFVTWEGRERHFETVFVKPSSMSDLRVLAALADGLGRPLGLRTAAQARAELVELGWWSGVRAAAPRIGAGTGVEPGPDRVLLATWRMQLDDSSAMSGEPYLRDTAQPPVAVLHPDTAAAAGVADRVRVSNDNGSITLPVRLAPEMVPGVVWLPTRPPGYDLASNLAAAAGDPVRIEPATESLPGGHVRSEHDGGAVR
ncbi:MAG: molybdopterin-dependent oxidoreductase, partial [Microlunatus sp.]|nr:molybdopterin-dependent oxidoreductase [Microlunatus sp.]